MTVINSQGTTLYVSDIPTTPWATCGEAIAALKTSPKVRCPQSLGDIAETRATSEYKCLSSNESTKALGAISRSNFELQVLLDPEDMTGQRLLREHFKNNTEFVLGIEFGKMMIYYTATVSGVSTGIAMDSAITTNFTIEISSDIKTCSTSNLVSHPVINNGIIVTNNGIPVVNTH